MRVWLWGPPAAAFLYWQNNGLMVSEQTVRIGRLPAPFRGFKLAQLSDLHGKRFGRGQAVLLDALRRAAPDLIVITGDLVDKRRDAQTCLDNATQLVRGAMKIAPVYFVTGNHEWQSGLRETLEKRLEAAGVTLLDNRAQVIRRGAAELRLAGLADEVSLDNNPTAWRRHGQPMSMGEYHKRRSERRLVLRGRLLELCGERQPPLCTVVLAHRPDLFSVCAQAGVSLVLSGHAHGGQVRMPLIGGVIAPDQGYFPRYTAGQHAKGEARMVVSRGLGNSAFPQRIFNRPELVLVSLR